MPERPIDRLLAVMERLRDPARGCPWDIEQTFGTIAPYTIEEAYEVADAIERGDFEGLADELGDLLLQVVYHAQMAKERGLFDFDEVARRIADKMIRRHPHVFGEERVDTAAEQRLRWEEMKAAERRARGEGEDRSALAGVPVGLPALTRAVKLQERAARVGFDWPEASQILDKLEEEIAELRDAMAAGVHERVAGEIGDLLFTVANVARRLDVDPEHALRTTNAKFERRFREMERSAAAAGRELADLDADGLEELWSQAKGRERGEAAGSPAEGEAGDRGTAQALR